ncbi:hypothetical protein HP15_2964 [Marinobacter adhaerens HP15]|uniref:Uncharacterized protein n=1 Tax=Marinobacter adhaerens (strain DSM 23420 / HP15) TaxID=225937 RepID=E4PN95_MARAH|nr:hypothetical protein HP15_2964 [Marinobacter adhaerens HP15]
MSVPLSFAGPAADFKAGLRQLLMEAGHGPILRFHFSTVGVDL